MSRIVFALSEMHWIGHVFLGAALVSAVCAFILFKLNERKNKQCEENTSNPPKKKYPMEPDRVKVDHLVIGYKTANLSGIRLSSDGDITGIEFKGLVGIKYGVQDSTTRSELEKFNMYSRVDDALEHGQNWGSTFLEVIASGNVEQHKLGYTAQHQRVLQIAFLECSRMYADEIKCDNEAEYLARYEYQAKLDEESYLGEYNYTHGYKPYCAGCVKRMNDVRLLAPYYNRRFTLDDGNTITVTKKSSREKIEFVPTAINGSTTASRDTNPVSSDAEESTEELNK